MDAVALLVVIIFAAALIFVGWSYGDSSSSSQFNIADWKVRFLQIAFGAFTVVGAGELIGITAFTYDLGYWVNGLAIGFAIGALILVFFGERARAVASENKLLSLPDYVAFLYGRNAALVTSLTSVIALGALLLIQLVVGGIAVATIAGTSTFIGMLVITVVVAAYVSIGGYKAILATDIVQGSAMMLALVALLLGAAFLGGGEPTPVAHLSITPSIDTDGILAAVTILVVSGAMAISGGADVWQRMLSAESRQSARNGLLLTSALFLVFGLLVYFVAINIISVNPASVVDPNNAFIDYLQTDLHPALKYIALLGIFAALVSTADAELLVIGLMLSKEANRWGLNKVIEPRDTRVGIILIAAALGIGGYFARDSLVEIFYYLLNLLMITGPIAWLCLLQRGRGWLIVLSATLAWAIFVWLVTTQQVSEGFMPLLIPAAFSLCFLMKNRQEIQREAV